MNGCAPLGLPSVPGPPQQARPFTGECDVRTGDPAELIGRHARNSHGPSAIEGLTVTATDAPTALRSGIAEPSLALVVEGRKRTVSGDRVFDYAAGEFLITQLDLPVIGQVTTASAERPFLGIGLRLEPSQIAAMLLESATALGRAACPGARHRRRERRSLPPRRARAPGGPPRRPAGRADPRAPLPARGALAAADRAAGRGRPPDRAGGRESRAHHPGRAVDPRPP